jgi:hypothetical protein
MCTNISVAIWARGWPILAIIKSQNRGSCFIELGRFCFKEIAGISYKNLLKSPPISLVEANCGHVDVRRHIRHRLR